MSNLALYSGLALSAVGLVTGLVGEYVLVRRWNQLIDREITAAIAKRPHDFVYATANYWKLDWEILTVDDWEVI